MNRLERLIHGYTEIEIVSAAPERCLNRLSENGIAFWAVETVSAFSVRFCVLYKERDRAIEMANRTQCDVSVLREQPGIRGLPRLLNRPFLLLAFAAACFSVIVLPTYVWTITVSGNETVPTDEILRALDELGVHFGTKNDTIESQDIKNRLLNAVDGLQWAAVNCSGGHCEVLVKEREKEPELLDRKLITDVVASNTGTVVELRVLQGEALCKVGDTVEEGQLLVSGITDRVIDIQTAHAQAEIYALTWQDLEAVTPQISANKKALEREHTCLHLQLGRFRIKISGNSRICGAGCDKMIIRKTLTLPGGYTFPVCLITERCNHYALEEEAISRKDAASLLSRHGARSVSGTMIAGTILSVDETVQPQRGNYRMTAVYACREMIAREQEVNLFGSEQIYGRKNSERRTD